MSSDRINRYKAQQAKIQLLREHREEIMQYRIPTTPAVDSTAVSLVPENDVLDQFRRSQKQELAYFNEPIHIDVNEVDALLSEIGTKWGKKQTSELIGNCRRSVISSIANPFGLGTFVAAWDKEGGNVTTQHNAEKGIFAKESEKLNREKDYSYSNARKNIKEEAIHNGNMNSQEFTDTYTGKQEPTKREDGNGKLVMNAELDHVIPVAEIHKQGGWMLNNRERDDISSTKENLKYTTFKTNRSKSDKTPENALSSDKGFDEKITKPVIDKARKAIDKKMPKNTDRLKYHSKELLNTGVHEAGKMGLQQSIGLLLTEFFSASFDEISDSYRNGFYKSSESKNFLVEVKIRLSRIVERVSARWKDAVIAFKDGAISGFLSNLATMLINMLETTSKRTVRLIREGFLSILKAMKIVLFPPAGMTNSEAGDAALKLLATGVTVSLGVLIEEVAEKSVKAFLVAHMQPLEQLTSTITAVLVGAFTGIATALVVATLDQLDLFGVTRQRKHEAILSELDRRIEESDRHIESMYQNEMGRMDVILSKLQGV